MDPSQNSNLHPANLRADAREFVPRGRNQNDYSPERETSNTRAGAIRKTYNENRRRCHQPTKYDHNRNEQSTRESSDGRFFQNNRSNGRYDSRPNDYEKKRSNANQGNYQNTERKPQFRGERKDHQQQREPDERPRRQPREKPDARKPANKQWRKKTEIDPTKISQREQLIKDIENHSLECMICMLQIKDYQAIWSCSNCFALLHMNCIKTWINNSKTESGEWRCVACQFLRTEIPKHYVCYCGKLKYPSNNQGELAHSCGEMCGRTDNCLHPCSLKCHPGAHLKCQSFVEKSCGCGKSTKTFQCSLKENFECEQLCGKLLSCGLHNCENVCHQGDCKACTTEISMKCHCTKDSKTELCSQDNALVTRYSCGKICELPLSCENHQCKQICHPEVCGSCNLSPDVIASCPCGKTSLDPQTRKSCADPIPLCKSQCSKVLNCGPLASPHVCLKLCHLAECPPCTKSTNVKCRCGRIEEKILCKDLLSTDVRCKKKCAKFKTCGRHKCNQFCCVSIEHPCTQQCGRPLECKKHRCAAPCHIGNCNPCQRASFDEMRCECGKVVVYPPIQCGVIIPECKNKCMRTHRCNHPVNHLCHSDPECPPCMHLTTKSCYGKHEKRNTIPCSQESFSCGLPCGVDIKCGLHKCIKNCHLGICEKPDDTCVQPCTTKKKCGHNCNVPCHAPKACPEKTCKFMIEVTCKCGNLKEMKSCEQVEQENYKIQRYKISMRVQNDDSFELNDIEVLKKTTKILECNNDCATLERNRRLDIAFKVENPNLINCPKFVPNYSEFVKTFYKKEPACANMIHEKLTELVKLAKDSKQKSRAYSFPVMNRDKRHCVHDLASMFGVETQAFDAEPNRNVVATAHRESSWLPSLSLAEVLAREVGQRQVRPPLMQLKK